MCLSACMMKGSIEKSFDKPVLQVAVLQNTTFIFHLLASCVSNIDITHLKKYENYLFIIYVYHLCFLSSMFLQFADND